MRGLRFTLALAWLGMVGGDHPSLPMPGDDETGDSRICSRCGEGVLRNQGGYAFCPRCKKIVGRWE